MVHIDKQDRIKKIVEIVKAKNGESIKALSEQLGVTEMTIRRDLVHLKASRLVKVVSGAVVYDGETTAVDNPDFYDLSTQRRRRTTEKYRIGKVAASLIEADDVVYFDIGTTASQIIQHVPSSLPIVAVCCTMNALIEVRKRKMENIIFIGGTYHSDVQMFESKEGIELLNRTRISKAFISAAGVDGKLGVTCINNYEVYTKQAAMQGALEKILVLDSSKFDVVKPAFFARLKDFDAIVTDSQLSSEWQDQIEALGIKLYIA